MLPVSTIHRINSDNASDFATLGCLSPKRIAIHDSVLGSDVLQPLPCGYCYNCRLEKMDEWTSRMLLHCLSGAWNQVFFVTLTFGNYNLLPFKHHPFKNDWLATMPIEDDFNYNSKKLYSPTVNYLPIYQKFIKRLRKLTGLTLSYCYCTEYGSTYGRPHAHFIIWAKNTRPDGSSRILTAEDVRLAWSYECLKSGDKYFINAFRGVTKAFKKSYKDLTHRTWTDKNNLSDHPYYFRFSLGQTKIYDLVSNGTLDPHVTLDKSTKGNCFRYVAKYLGKTDPMLSELIYLDHDVTLDVYSPAILKLLPDLSLSHLLKRFITAYHKYVLPYKSESVSLDSFMYKMYSIYTHSSCFVPSLTYEDALHQRHTIPLRHPETFEFTDYNDFKTKYQSYYESTFKNLHCPLLGSDCTFSGLSWTPISFTDFCKEHSSRFIASKKYSIGKDYFLANYQRLLREDYNLPEFQGKKICFPHYFYRLLNLERYPLRFRKTSPLSKSLVKGDLQTALRFFKLLGSCSRSVAKNLLFNKDSLSCSPSFCLDESPYSGRYFDISLCSPFKTVHYYYSAADDCFYGFTYSHRVPIFQDYLSREEFCEMALEYLNLQFVTVDLRKTNYSIRTQIYTYIKNNSRSMHTIAEYLHLRDYNSHIYKLNHNDPL